jgi:glycosyltransferase involved in cell wall biosynthesis
MKIGILIDRLNVGGVEKIAIEQVLALRQAGQDAYLVVLRKKAVVANAFPDLIKNVPIIYLDERLPSLLKFSFRIPGFHFFSFFHLSYAVFLPFFVKTHEFDYIIAHGTYTSLSAAAMKARNSIRFSSFIWDPASYIMERVYTGRFLLPVLTLLKRMAVSFDTYLIKRMDHVLVGGKAHNPFIERIVPGKSIEIIYPSVHPALKQTTKQDYVLMVTAWKDGKHPEYLLDVMKHLPGVHVKMVGKWIDPQYKKDFEHLVKKHGLDEFIDIVGEVNEKQLSAFYASALVLLQTNDDRGFGMPAMEAAAHGTTFIIPEGQGVGELFTDKVHGFYTKENDTEKIVQLITKLTEDKSLATSLGQSAMAIVKSNYSWKKHANKLVSVIEESLGLQERTLHVLFTGLVSPTMLSGGDQLFLDIAPRLPKDLHITIVTPRFAKSHWDKVDQSNITLKYLGKNIFEFSDNPFSTFCSYVIRSIQTYNILRKENIQSIYSCSDVAYADIWPAYFIAGNNPNIKWLTRIYHILLPPASRHGNHIVNLIVFKLQRLSFWMMKRRSSTIMALNPKLYEDVLNLGFPKQKLRILGAGIDFATLHQFQPIKKYTYDVVILGRIAPVKGIFDAVKIWRKVHAINPSLRLGWVGGGQEFYVKQVKHQLEEYDLSGSFDLLGFVDNETKNSILKSATIFLCTDHEIGWGLAVSEAMAMGLPVITYNNDVFGSVYKKGFVSVELFNIDSFAKEIIRLFNDQRLRKSLSKDALNQAKEFDHKKVVDDLVKYLAV